MKKTIDEQYEEKKRDVAGELSIKHSRTLDNVAKVITLVLAIAIWLYVVGSNVVEKPLPLTFKEKNGLDFSDRVTLEYQSLIVRGASAFVDPMQQLHLEDFSAKNLDDEDGDGVVEIELGIKEDTLPEGISEILKANGTSFPGGVVKVKATVKVGHSHEVRVPKEYVKLSNSSYELIDDYVTLTVRSLSADDDHTLINQLNAYLDPNNLEAQNMVVTVFMNVEGKEAKIESVNFEGNFKGQMYEVLNGDDSAYRVMEKIVTSGENK